MATKVQELALTQLITPIGIEPKYQHYHLLVRAEHQPIGWISLRTVSQKEEITTQEIYVALQAQLNANLVRSALSRRLRLQQRVLAPAPKISVVICTRNRTENLRRCLGSFATLQYEGFEIIVVDNAPNNEDTYRLANNFPVRYVREDRPGLDWARNCGIANASNEIVAFTDDDALVDPYWLDALAKAFSDPEVMAVTGFVAPSELETNAQHIFEFGYGGMGHGFSRKTIKKENLSSRELLWASGFGVGANMAFRKEVFHHIGNFDVALDVGTASHGGGDIEMFHRLVYQGYKLVYNPGAIIWHTHRKEMAALKKQVFDNGRAFGCYLLTCLRHGSITPKTVTRFLVVDWLKNWIFRNLVRPRKYFPRKLALIEFLGMMTSPFAYRASQANAKKITTSLPLKKTTP